jgi:(p)ppGpp synthase/HD superfamily hydrolase
MPLHSDEVVLSEKYAEALCWAFELHNGQIRKNLGMEQEPQIPYFAHLIAVSALVVELGGSECEAVSALFHDALEDGPDCLRRRRGLQKNFDELQTLRNEIAEEIERKFGVDVLNIVRMCSEDAAIVDKTKRKEAYLAQFVKSSASAQIVMLCDKLHNAESILREHVRLGKNVWKKFSLGPKKHRTVLSKCISIG